nr:immunoglobulin heavy chain junction region [Macaca mulatta]MOV86841.1 immunoglobulin heavy chain junction region [Macaca mulatta]MOV87388.1 immunoglobulin heavy chain junction region [Macaca mulatta]MOV87671.1 immunoglobulin heavy chain junction region [Macaca mulatta]MOV87851.1 immunoglobulin heavy chain junction region [Macaca mulatta]
CATDGFGSGIDHW